MVDLSDFHTNFAYDNVLYILNLELHLYLAPNTFIMPMLPFIKTYILNQKQLFPEKERLRINRPLYVLESNATQL